MKSLSFACICCDADGGGWVLQGHVLCVFWYTSVPQIERARVEDPRAVDVKGAYNDTAMRCAANKLQHELYRRSRLKGPIFL